MIRLCHSYRKPSRHSIVSPVATRLRAWRRLSLPLTKSSTKCNSTLEIQDPLFQHRCNPQTGLHTSHHNERDTTSSTST